MKFNKYLYTVLFFAVSFTTSLAQNGRERHEKIEAAKIAFITEKIDLNSQQAELFWPIYNEYSDKRRKLHRKIIALRDQSDNLAATDQQLEQSLNELFDIKQMELALDKAYKDKLLAILSPRQVIALYKAEKEFLVFLHKKVSERRNR